VRYAGLLATRRASLAGVFPIAGAMTADDAKGPSRAVCEPWAMALAGDRTGQPATDFALALALVLAPLTMSDNARDNAHYTIPGPSLESPDFVGVVRNSGER
jgi:hypothetical protein